MFKRALIGYSGFVGSNLAKQINFTELFNSKNISEITGKAFDELFISGLPAAKWMANKEPKADIDNVNMLVRNLQSVKAKKVVLISTVDIYGHPIGVDEDSIPDLKKDNFYGRHRLLFEEEVKKIFENTSIFRLPGLFGPGLKKNVIYDFMHNYNIDKIDSRAEYQFYNLSNLYSDVEKARANNIPLLNITSVPISVHDVARICFGRNFINEIFQSVPRYDVKSKYDFHWNGVEGYLYSKEHVLRDIVAFIDGSRNV